jgi:predicted TIM-barrel enzyme
MPDAIAVIHHRDVGTTVHNAILAREAGFDGVALIEMMGADADLFDPLMILRSFYGRLPTSFKVGVNFLSYDARDAFNVVNRLQLDFLWLDNPGVSSKGYTDRALIINKELEKVPPYRKFQFFGSVAFKTQGPEPDPVTAAFIARSFGWNVTTSGPETGAAPDLDKIKKMYSAVGPVSIASGMTPENIASFAPYVDTVFVATGISSSFHVFDEDKCNRFIRNLR